MLDGGPITLLETLCESVKLSDVIDVSLRIAVISFPVLKDLFTLTIDAVLYEYSRLFDEEVKIQHLLFELRFEVELLIGKFLKQLLSVLFQSQIVNI